MSSTGKTAIGLNQWQLQEKPLMSDFNSDNDILTKYLLALSGSGLLINSNFSVWQLATSYTVTTTANYGDPDRWKFKQVSGTPVISQLTATSGLKCTGGSCTMMYLMDAYDLANVSGQVCTLSYKLNGTIKANQITPTSQTILSITLANGDQLEWVKLELGSQSTEYTPPSYSNNFKQCQFYFQKLIDPNLDFAILCSFLNSTGVEMNLSFGQMRTAPTVTTKQTGTFGRIIGTRSNGDIVEVKSVTSWNAYTVSNGMLTLQFGLDSVWGGNTITPTYDMLGSSYGFYLDAEL